MSSPEQDSGRTDRITCDGRSLITRAGICQEHGVSESKARGWWRERATNAHPQPVRRQGRRLWWDAAEMRTFVATLHGQAEQRGAPGEMIQHGGRTLISRKGLARRFHLDPGRLAILYHQRQTNGHPEPVHKVGRVLYWDVEVMDVWERERQVAKRAKLTPVDRTGDPDELADITEATRVLGYSDEGTIRSFMSRNRGYFPHPAETGPDGRPRWHRRSLWEFADRRSRPGRAGHARTSG